MFAISFTFTALLVVSTANTSGKQCPQIKLQFPFDVNQFLGTWYEIQRLGLAEEEETELKCVSVTYGLQDDANLRIERTGVADDGERETDVGVGLKNDLDRASFVFQFTNKTDMSVGIIDTNYSEYALLYSCQMVNESDGRNNGQVREAAWILSRNHQLDETTTEILKGLLIVRRVDTSKFKRIEQDC